MEESKLERKKTKKKRKKRKINGKKERVIEKERKKDRHMRVERAWCEKQRRMRTAHSVPVLTENKTAHS